MYQYSGIPSTSCVNIRENSKELLGSTMTVDVDPISLANKIIEDLKVQRKKISR